MKFIVSDHERPSDSEILDKLRAGEWEYTRDDLMQKAVMYYLYIEQNMTVQEIDAYLSERVEKPYTSNDVTMSLRWFGLMPSVGKPLQTRARSIADCLSFGWEL